MILYKNKEDCFGCGACENSCPKNAILMVPDEQGFLYPEINAELCVNCNLCKMSCQIRHEDELKGDESVKCFGFKNEDIIRMRSSSGGAYTAISDKILSEGGICYGTVFSDRNDVIFQKARTKQERDLFLGSKYVQSSIGRSYYEIGIELRNQEIVLFTGTPCQVAGLKQYLKGHKISTDRLLTIDLLCHGTPSPKLWKDYVRFLEKKNNGKMIAYSFRNKERGWIGYHIKVEYDNGMIEYDSHEALTFLNLFSMDLTLRPSCYSCPYACKGRCGDITIGDFWGCHKLDQEFTDNKGISLLIANSEKGDRMLADILENPSYTWKEYPLCSTSQPNLEYPTLKNAVTDLFWTHYQKKGFLWIAQTYGGYNNNSFINKIERSIVFRLHSWRNKRRMKQ